MSQMSQMNKSNIVKLHLTSAPVCEISRQTPGPNSKVLSVSPGPEVKSLSDPICFSAWSAVKRYNLVRMWGGRVGLRFSHILLSGHAINNQGTHEQINNHPTRQPTNEKWSVNMYTQRNIDHANCVSMQSHHVTHARMGIWSPAAVLHPCRALQMSICCYTRVTCTRAQTATLIQQVLRWKERLKKTITSGTFWSLVHTRYSNGFMLLKEQHHCTTMALQATHSDAKCFCHYPQLTVSSNREAWEIFARPSDRHSFIKTKLPVRCLAHAPPRIEYLHTVYNKFKILKFTKYSLHSQKKKRIQTSQTLHKSYTGFELRCIGLLWRAGDAEQNDRKLRVLLLEGLTTSTYGGKSLTCAKTLKSKRT